jgi:hypothetical protein
MLLGRRQRLRDERRHVLHLQFVLVLHFLRHLSRRQVEVGEERAVLPLRVVRPQHQFGVQHRNVALQHPGRRQHDHVGPPALVAVLEDAPRLHARQAEALGPQAHAARLEQHLVVDLAVEGDDLAVGLNRARGDVGDAAVVRIAGDVRDLDVRVLLPLLAEDLDAVILRGGGVRVVVTAHPVQDRRRNPGCVVDALHRQLRGRSGAEILRLGKTTVQRSGDGEAHQEYGGVSGHGRGPFR